MSVAQGHAEFVLRIRVGYGLEGIAFDESAQRRRATLISAMDRAPGDGVVSKPSDAADLEQGFGDVLDAVAETIRLSAGVGLAGGFTKDCSRAATHLAGQSIDAVMHTRR